MIPYFLILYPIILSVMPSFLAALAMIRIIFLRAFLASGNTDADPLPAPLPAPAKAEG